MTASDDRRDGAPAEAREEVANAGLSALVLERLGPHPFLEHLGVRLIAANAGTVRLGLPWRAQHSRSGVAPGGELSLHGGAAATLADMAASCALLTLLNDGDGRTTIDLSIHYLAPLRGDVVADARVRRRGGRTAIIDVELFDSSETLGAIARVTFAIQPAPAGTGIP